MSTRIKTKTGKTIVLLNPAEKGKRYGRQLKHNCVTETGEVLDEKGRAFRKGYLSARSDSAKAYQHKQGKPSNAKRYDKKTKTWVKPSR